MGALGSKYCEKHPTQETMFICLSESPPLPICAVCMTDQSHANHTVRATKNLAAELMEKFKVLPEKMRKKFKKAVEQPKSSTAFEEILKQGKKMINEIFGRVSKRLEVMREESIASFASHIRFAYNSIPVNSISGVSLPPLLQQLLEEVKAVEKTLDDLYTQREYIEICRRRSTYEDIKTRLKQFMLTLQNDYVIRKKLEAYQIHFEEGEFKNKFRKLVQSHLKFYYTDEGGNEEIIPVKVNRLHSLSVADNSVSLFDIHSKQWSTMKFKQQGGFPDMGVQTIEGRDNKIYIIGGKRGTKYLNDVFTLNEETKSLEKFPLLNVARAYHGVATCGAANFCVVGGENTEPYLSSCEMYSSKTSTWDRLPNLNTKRQAMGCCCLGANYVYVIGGFQEKYLNSIEQLSIVGYEKGWVEVKMGDSTYAFTPRQSCAAIPINDTQILIFGGYNEKVLSNTYIYNHDTHKVMEIDHLSNPEEFATYSYDILENYVFCLCNDVIHLYDINKEKWIAQKHDISSLELSLH
eukprot:TRINITY_DN1128_c0_g6_i1.p1 TRINITY_DN1128_c0_g6~~TRINITY_DN1128_c0_g6_i1.p1  ORF type:complete len:521 (-),score=146.16 TRINITY_DN1128_c0_g6_i1:138-1700(-)